MGVRRHTRFAVSVLALAGAVSVMPGVAAGGQPRLAAAARSRSCRSVIAQGTRFQVTISRGRVSCRTARRVLRAFMSGKGKLHGPANGPAYLQSWSLYGWRCGHGTGGGACIRHGTNYKNARDYIGAQAS
jgi:hypothetical protein